MSTRLVDSSGETRLVVDLDPVPTAKGTAGGDLTGTYPNPTVAAAKITLAKMIGTFAYLLVQTGVPVTLSSPLVYDDTAVSGGLYAWSGVAYVKIAGLAP